MKILLDHGNPFLLAHGGFQIQIEQTKLALEAIGVDVDFMHWWDDSQRPDLIHFFGACPASYAQLAHAKGIKVIMSELRGGTGARSLGALAAQRLLTCAGRRLLPRLIVGKLAWDIYQRIDAAIALTTCEARIMREISECPPERLHVVPNGVEDIFFDTTPAPEVKWLVCTATVQSGKRVLELARAASEAQVPLWIIGKPYAEGDAYFRAFHDFARAHPQWVRYEGAIDDRQRLAEIYRGARGFVLVSTWESQSLSALEAAAARCPLLLADLPWARATFADRATYCPSTSDVAILARHLRAFWETDHRTSAPFVPLRWTQVAERLRAIYAGVLATAD